MQREQNRNSCNSATPRGPWIEQTLPSHGLSQPQVEEIKIRMVMFMLVDDALREFSSPGKSGSIFYLTQDDKFMIKTVKKSEVKLLGRSSGFQVASTHRSCTKGLWMWSAPLKRTALDGTEYHLLLLDSEGIDAYDQTKMAVSAFRSTSKRGNLGASLTTISSTKENNIEELGKKVPSRRSRSVSALCRTSYEKSSSSAASNILEFLNKSDNPLFCCSSSPSPPDELESKPMVGISKSSANATNIIDSVNKSTSASVLNGRRGRSVTRSSDLSNQFLSHRKEVGRSLSMVDTGRRPRSISRGHYRSSESEVINDCSSAANLRNKRIGNVVGMGRVILLDYPSKQGSCKHG